MPAAEASPWRVVGMASLVALAYYVGSWIGLLLAVPPGPTSALWPPNAILTAALLLTPVHRWWTYVLAVVPVHLLAQIGTVHPPALIAALFVTNWSEALLGAIGVRLFSDAPARLDTFQRMAIFIGAVGLGAPLVSSFADAAAVTALTGQEYWGVLRTRFFANVLTELTVASTILGAVAAGRRRTSSAPGRRAEAIALAAVVIAVGVLVFDGGVGTPTGLSSRTLVLLLLPVFLWGAVRFGPVGISASLLAVSTLAVWGAQLGRGPFATVPADERVLLLQVSSIMVTIPLLCVAAVVAERRDSARALRDSLHFEKLISELSSACVRLPPERLDEVVFLLGDLADYLGLQSLTVSRISPDGTTTWYAWDASDRTAASDPGASAPAVLVVPLMAHDRCLGDLTLTLPSTGQSRATDWMPRITVVAEVLGSALADQEATRALRASESMNSAILASLTTAPARRFGFARRKGRIAPGMDADLVILAADPAQDIEAFARVRHTIRGGRVMFSA